MTTALRSAADYRPSLASIGLSSLLLLVVGIQGFHVVEHIVLVVQVSALGMSVAEAHGLLGQQVDFEYLHLSYNGGFFLALFALAMYAWRRQPAAARWVVLLLTFGVLLQAYHVAEHVGRVVQYVRVGCTPCEGWIGKLILFIWPHLFFGLFSYIPFVAGYLAMGLHRPLLDPILGRTPPLTERAPVT